MYITKNEYGETSDHGESSLESFEGEEKSHLSTLLAISLRHDP